MRITPRFLLLLGALAASSVALSHPLEPDARERAFAPRPIPELPTYTVKGDIAALRNGGLPAHEAGYRLIARGSAILPQLHGALLAPNAQPKQRLQLVTVLAEIGSASSVTPIIKVTAMAPRNLVLKAQVAAKLARLPASADSFAFLARQLDGDKVHPYVRRTALATLAQQRDPRCADWANRFLAQDSAPELQAISLLCLARLGNSDAAKPIAGIVQSGEMTEVRLALMLAYAELVEPGEFAGAFGPGAARSAEFLRDYRSGLRYAQLRWLPDDGKAAVAEMMLDGKHAVEKQLGAQYLIAASQMDVLERQVQPTTRPPVHRLVQNELRRAGFAISREGEGLRIVAPQGNEQ